MKSKNNIQSFADKPRLSLTLGRTLNPSQIKEGDDVYFECLIVSNPAATRLEWYWPVFHCALYCCVQVPRGAAAAAQRYRRHPPQQPESGDTGGDAEE